MASSQYISSIIRIGVIPAHLGRRCVLLVIEKLKAAGVGFKRSVTVCWKLSLQKAMGARTEESRSEWVWWS